MGQILGFDMPSVGIGGGNAAGAAKSGMGIVPP